MSNFTDFISGGGGGLPVNIILGYSQTWVPPVDGNICIHVVGAGGGGTGMANNLAYSGGAGGYCKKNSLAVTTAGSFTVVVGAGGAGNADQAAGGTGGNSTFAGTGLASTLTANGGGGGGSGSQGAGGTAANGDVNNTGGAGLTPGGGAVGITGTGNTGVTEYGGGDCDVIGPESLMGYGFICGGKGGKRTEVESSSTGVQSIGPDADGGFLAGGGLFHVDGTNTNYETVAGNGGIGGGGAGCLNDINSSRANGGNGGNGIVIIQYLPA